MPHYSAQAADPALTRTTIAAGISGRLAHENALLPPPRAGYPGSSRPSTTKPAEKHDPSTADSGRWKK